MIIVLDALNWDSYPRLMDEMYMLRARVFQDRLGWDVDVKEGREIDEFDALDPAYMVSVDDDGHVVGCMRVLQTTGPHMLSDVFSDILNGEPPIRSATVWEATRFCVDTQRLSVGRGRNSISYVTSELMLGALGFAMKAGIQDAIAVIDPLMDRILKRSGNAPYDYIGSPKQMGKVKALAGLLDCTEERLDRIRGFSGIQGDVFATEEALLALAEPGRVAA